MLHSCRVVEAAVTGYRISWRHTTLRWRPCMTRMSFSSYLVTPKQLDEAIRTGTSDNSRIIPLCASWFLPNDPEKRTGRAVFEALRIPGARFFDLDAIKDNDSPYPHMLPSAPDFATAMSSLGIRKDDRVVVYDSKELGIFSAPRVAWTLKVFAHARVHVLNNFKVWVDKGYPTESGSPQAVEQSEYPEPTVNLTEVVDFHTVRRNAQLALQGKARFQLLDARPQGRFDGTSPEPRPGMPSGHVPGSVSVPFSDLLDPQTKTLLPGPELARIFRAKKVDFEAPIVSCCGTGVTAAVVDAALAEAGHPDPASLSLYDGSWTEWAQRATVDEGLIVKTGKS